MPTIWRRRLAAWLGVAMLSSCPAWAAAQAVALVVDHAGQASIGGPSAPKSVATLAALPAGTQVTLQPGASMTVLYVASGDEYTVTGPGTTELGAASPAVAGGATVQHRAPKAGKTPQLRADAVTMGGIVMRNALPRPREPAGLVTTAPVRLVWDALAADASYRIELRDDAGGLLFEQRVQGLSVPFPANVPLPPGSRYRWTVAPDHEEGANETTPPAATFEMASADLRAQAVALKPGEGAAFSERVAYALWLEQIGAQGEARQQWERLVEERPDDAALRARARR